MRLKDAEGTIDNSNHPEVVKEVLKKIKALGDDSKSNFETLQKDYEETQRLMKEAEKNLDPLITEKISKFAEDITVRQQASEDHQKEVDARVDELDAAIQRTSKVMESGEDVTQIAKDFKIAALAAQQKLTPITDIDAITSIDEFNAYKDLYPIYLRRDERSLNADQIKSMSVGVDPDGGYLVTPQMSSRIVQRIFEADPVRQFATVETISTGALEMLVEDDEADCGWEGETVAGDETNTPKLGKKRIPVHVMYAKPRATQTLLEDAGINVENWLANKVAGKMMRYEGAAFVTGNGVGQPRGFLTYPDGGAYGNIEQVHMGAAAVITTDGLLNVKYSLIEYYLTRSRWLANRLAVADIMKLKDGDGQYIWRPGLQEGQPSLLLGLPFNMSTSMPVVVAGALSIALADWAEAYTVVDRLGISIQRDPYTVKPFVEFYTRKRVGGDVVNFRAIKLGLVAL